MTQMPIRWKLKELLESEGKTPYALAEKMGGASRRPTIYAITSPVSEKRPTKVGFPLLESILHGMKELTGKTYSVSSVLENDEVDAQ